jgi:hypothetical protein
MRLTQVLELAFGEKKLMPLGDVKVTSRRRQWMLDKLFLSTPSRFPDSVIETTL